MKLPTLYHVRTKDFLVKQSKIGLLYFAKETEHYLVVLSLADLKSCLLLGWAPCCNARPKWTLRVTSCDCHIFLCQKLYIWFLDNIHSCHFRIFGAINKTRGQGHHHYIIVQCGYQKSILLTLLHLHWISVWWKDAVNKMLNSTIQQLKPSD